MTGRLLTVGHVAEELGCSIATVKRRIRSGALPAFVDGRLVRVREADLARYIAERVARHQLITVPAPTASGRRLPPGSRLWD
jgi:excisionase family DNA binding protein